MAHGKQQQQQQPPQEDKLQKVIAEMESTLVNIRHIQLTFLQRSLVEWIKILRERKT